MSIIFRQGIGFGQAGVYYLQNNTVDPIYRENPNDATADRKPLSPIDIANGNPWSPWGAQNNLPKQIGHFMDNCGVLFSGIDTKARIATGKNLVPFLLKEVDPETGAEKLEYCKDLEIHDFIEANNAHLYAYSLTRDSLGYGMDATRLIYNRGRSRINRFERIDIATLRLEKANAKTGLIEHTYQSWDWEAGRSYDPQYYEKLPLLQPGNELADLQARNDSYQYAFINRNVTNNRFYYPLPLWWAAKIWVEIAMEIPLYKKSAYKNQMSMKYQVSISDNYWKNNIPNWSKLKAEEQIAARNIKLNELDQFLSGSENAHKSIISSRTWDGTANKEIEDIVITVLDDKMKDGKMLPDSAAADKQVLFALQMNPALNGSNLLSDGASGGGGSGSDIREAFLVQLMLNEFERRKAARLFHLIKHVNGWQARYADPLVFRYPASILTTLDTGKSTKPENA